jgi:hypothetical protein
VIYLTVHAENWADAACTNAILLILTRFPQKFAEAERIKEKGNSSFREGNFPVAKAFYLDALSKVTN